MNKTIITKSLIHGLLFVGIAAIIVAIVMGLWNLIIPTITGFSAITYWQALGIVILSRILTGGFRKKTTHIHQRHDARHEQYDQMSRDEKKEYLKNLFSKKSINSETKE